MIICVKRASRSLACARNKLDFLTAPVSSRENHERQSDIKKKDDFVQIRAYRSTVILIIHFNHRLSRCLHQTRCLKLFKRISEIEFIDESAKNLMTVIVMHPKLGLPSQAREVFFCSETDRVSLKGFAVTWSDGAFSADLLSHFCLNSHP